MIISTGTMEHCANLVRDLNSGSWLENEIQTIMSLLCEWNYVASALPDPV